MCPMKRATPPPDAATEVTLSLEQLARRWHKTRKEIRRLLADRILDFVQIRGRLRVCQSAVERYERTHLAGRTRKSAESRR